MSQLQRSLWGPALWSFLHTAAATLDSPAAFVQILLALPDTLPCPECRRHTEDFFQKRPPHAEVQDALTASRYCFEMHNAVNVRLGKKLASRHELHARHGVLLPAPASVASRGGAEAPSDRRPFQRVRPYRMI